MSEGKSMRTFFAGAVKSGVLVEVHIDHPSTDYQRQYGIVYAAEAEYLVIGPEGAPQRVCVPYRAVKWFRRMDDVI